MIMEMKKGKRSLTDRDWRGFCCDRVYLADQCLPNRVQASLIQGADFVTVEFESFQEESDSLCR